MRPFLVVATSVLACLVGPGAAAAAPGWTDVPALLDAAVAPQAAALRACGRARPRVVGLVASRAADGHTRVGMPMPSVGHRGFTPEERCLMKAIAAIELPPLPVGVDRVRLAYRVVAADAPLARHEKRFDDWRDLPATLARVFDDAARAALVACDPAPRTVRLVLDRRGDRTRIWLPAWQFHAATGDGTTPPRQRAVKACLTAAIRGWHAPVLPLAMGELQLALSLAGTGGRVVRGGPPPTSR